MGIMSPAPHSRPPVSDQRGHVPAGTDIGWCEKAINYLDSPTLSTSFFRLSRLIRQEHPKIKKKIELFSRQLLL